MPSVVPSAALLGYLMYCSGLLILMTMTATQVQVHQKYTTVLSVLYILYILATVHFYLDRLQYLTSTVSAVPGVPLRSTHEYSQ